MGGDDTLEIFSRKLCHLFDLDNCIVVSGKMGMVTSGALLLLPSGSFLPAVAVAVATAM